MREYANIILERPDGPHGLDFGEYVFEKTETALILYIGIGTFGQGGGGGGGIIPSGTLDITENGTYNIRLYENVNVNVQAHPPTGTIEITENGTVDVTNYGTAIVDVQGAAEESYEANIDNIVIDLAYTENITESYEADLVLA